jgi:hypothetical protein
MPRAHNDMSIQVDDDKHANSRRHQRLVRRPAIEMSRFNLREAFPLRSLPNSIPPGAKRRTVAAHSRLMASASHDAAEQPFIRNAVCPIPDDRPTFAPLEIWIFAFQTA